MGAGTRLRAAELRLAQTFGAAATLVKRVRVADPETLTNTWTETSTAIASVRLQRRRQVDPSTGRMVQLDELEAIIPAATGAPQPDANDQLAISGARYSIVGVELRGTVADPRSYVCKVVKARAA